MKMGSFPVGLLDLALLHVLIAIVTILLAYHVVQSGLRRLPFPLPLAIFSLFVFSGRKLCKPAIKLSFVIKIIIKWLLRNKNNNSWPNGVHYISRDPEEDNVVS